VAHYWPTNACLWLNQVLGIHTPEPQIPDIDNNDRPTKVQKWKCVRPSAIQGKGQFFLGGGALPVMRPLSKFSNSCLHSCCRTEEIKFSIKPITRKPIQNLWLFYKIKYKKQWDAHTCTISVLPTPRTLNGHSATGRKLCRCAAKNESTLAVIYYGRVWSRDTVIVPCVWWSHTWTLAIQVSIKVTREWELSFLTTKGEHLWH